jgi:hypothetical protein
MRSISGSVPDLTGATLNFTMRHKRVSGVSIQGTGAVISQSDSETVIRVSIARTETAKGRTHFGDGWLYDLQATLADGSVLTLVGPQAPGKVLLDQTQ